MSPSAPNSTPPEASRGPVGTSMSWSALRWWLRAIELFSPSETQKIYLWSVVAGILGFIMCTLFTYGVDLLQSLFTMRPQGEQLCTFSSLSDWMRVLVPALGGIMAGFTLWYAHKYSDGKPMEYMEAVVLGDGHVAAKPNLLRTLSAMFSISSGASIGREGPLAQASAVAASYVGNMFRLSVPRLRLVVACAAAAGMSATFHTPLAGGLFVSEILIGTLTMQFLGPMLVASCTGYFLMALLRDGEALYQVESLNCPHIESIGWCVFLAVLAACVAKGWLFLLKYARKYLNGRPQWLPIRLALSGVLVGVILISHPEIVGNGAHIIRKLIHFNPTVSEAAVMMGLKVLAVVVVFGVGTVGGVLTPCLTLGSLLGYLTHAGLVYAGVPENQALAYALIGMAAFFTAAASAPLTSLVLVIEFTMDGHLIFPLVVAVLVSYGMARFIKIHSIYASATQRGAQSVFEKPMLKVLLGDIASTAPPKVDVGERFGRVASMLVKNPGEMLFVVNKSGKYVGNIVSSDVLEYARNEELADAVIAMDLARTDFPKLHDRLTLPEALGIFARHPKAEALALVDNETGCFISAVNRVDLYLALSEIMRHEKIR